MNAQATRVRSRTLSRASAGRIGSTLLLAAGSTEPGDRCSSSRSMRARRRALRCDEFRRIQCLCNALLARLVRSCRWQGPYRRNAARTATLATPSARRRSRAQAHLLRRSTNVPGCVRAPLDHGPHSSIRARSPRRSCNRSRGLHTEISPRQLRFRLLDTLQRAGCILCMRRSQ